MSEPARPYPRPGTFSAMGLTWMAAAVAIPVGLLSPAAQTAFDVPLSPHLADLFALSALIMVAHKVESHRTGEFDVAPLYLRQGQAPWAQNPREAMFMVFVTTFLGMLGFVALVLRGGHWPMLMMTVWLAQGVLELHHSAKAAASRGYYSGLFTGLLFSAFMGLFFFPAWRDALALPAWVTPAFAAAHPVAWALFYGEHRRWLSAVSPL